MAGLNRRVGPPEVSLPFWTGAVGIDQSLIDGYTGMAARGVVVTVVGTLVLVELTVGPIIFTAADIVAQYGILRGQWVQASAAGSTAHTLVGWW